MNPAVIRLIILAVEAVCVLVVTTVSVKDAMDKRKDRNERKK